MRIRFVNERVTLNEKSICQDVARKSRILDSSVPLYKVVLARHVRILQ